jgi:BASS family bile acid:Na+ symporter
MNIVVFFRKLKSYMMPITMIIGIVFYSFFSRFSFLTPYLIFTMLFITYCNIELKEIRLKKMHLWLILIQVVGCILVYGLLYPFNPIVAQGAMICVLAPTATSAVVITGMLGGNTASLTAYSFLCNLTVAICAPVIFAVIGNHSDVSFFAAMIKIGKNILILLILPFALAFLVRRFASPVQRKIHKSQGISFYLWNIALLLVSSQIVYFILDGQKEADSRVEIYIAFAALIICCLQFIIGKTIGSKYNDRIAGGQGLGQKNTVLAIWMAQTYLNPISSIGPGSYVLWQNIINSYQVWKRRKQN